MEGPGHPIYHDVGLDHTLVSTGLYEPHYPHITAFRMELESWSVYYLEPRVLMREEVPLAAIERIGPRGENLAAFLNTLKHKHRAEFDDFNLALKKVLPTDPQIDVELLKEGLVALRLAENGIWFSARLISEGTLRLIGLLAAVHRANPATVIAFEEPENGVNPVRLKLIGEVLKNVVKEHGKQIIVTTHSPVFPDYFNKDLFISSREGRQTAIKPFVASSPLFRRSDIEQALE
jgi:predicted ATPase